MKSTAGTAAYVVGFILALMAVALPFMWIWNYAVVAAVTVAKPIGYWTAFWLIVFLSVFVVDSRSSSGAKK